MPFYLSIAVTEIPVFVANLTPVPSLGGRTAAIYLALAISLAAAAAWSVADREKSLARVAEATVVALLILVALTRLPSELSTRYTQWGNQRVYDAASAEDAVQGSHVDPAFVDFADRTIPPGASFAVFTGPEIRSSGPQSWLQWSLLPRIEEYQRPCRAEWFVLVDLADPPSPIRISSRAVFAPGYVVARNEARCES